MSLLVIILLVFSGPLFAFEKGEKIPEIYGSLLNGKLFRLRKYLTKPAVINFFSVTCIPCCRELPEIADLERKFPDVQFVAVHLGDEDSEKIEAFLKKLPNAPSVIVKASEMVRRDYNINRLPFTIYADKDGTVIHEMVGFTPQYIKTLGEILSQ